MTECHNECGTCFRIFKYRRNLAQHMKSHDSAGGKLRCSFCSMKFNNMPALRNHHETNHITGGFPCSLCNTSYRSSVHLMVCYWSFSLKQNSEFKQNIFFSFTNETFIQWQFFHFEKLPKSQLLIGKTPINQTSCKKFEKSNVVKLQSLYTKFICNF